MKDVSFKIYSIFKHILGNCTGQALLSSRNFLSSSNQSFSCLYVM